MAKRIEDLIYSNFENEHQKALVNIQYTANRLRNNISKRLGVYGITLTQFNVLRILRGQHPNAASIGLIKERLVEESSDVSRMIDRMVQKEIVERSECAADRRQKDVLISAKGLEILKRIDDNDLMSGNPVLNLSDEEALQLNTLLNKIRF